MIRDWCGVVCKVVCTFLVVCFCYYYCYFLFFFLLSWDWLLCFIVAISVYYAVIVTHVYAQIKAIFSISSKRKENKQTKKKSQISVISVDR